MNGPLFTFPLMGYPVQVGWTAALLVAYMIFGTGGTVAEGVLWGVVVFVSILVHELGHALVGERLGLKPTRIVLHGFGGLCEYSKRPNPKQGVISALAGPFAGIALGTVFFGISMVLPGDIHPGVAMLVGWMVQVNIFWSLFNLLPMFPLDGGGVMANGLLMATNPRKAWAITRWVSIACAVLVGIGGYMVGMRFVPIIAILVIMQNLRR